MAAATHNEGNWSLSRPLFSPSLTLPPVFVVRNTLAANIQVCSYAADGGDAWNTFWTQISDSDIDFYMQYELEVRRYRQYTSCTGYGAPPCLCDSGSNRAGAAVSDQTCTCVPSSCVVPCMVPPLLQRHSRGGRLQLVVTRNGVYQRQYS